MRSPRRLSAPWTAGCAPDDEDALTFFFAANPDERDVRMRIVDEFQRRHPDIKVRPVLSAPGVMQQLATFCAGGKCPDVMMAWDLTYAELAARGVLLDLNTLLARDHAVRSATAVRRRRGAAMTASRSREVSTHSRSNGPGNYLFYNKRLFAEAGVPAPSRTWEQPWSFAEFLDTATALTKRNASGRATQWGFVNMWFSYYSAGLFGMNNGVPWATPLKNPAHFNFGDDAFIDAVQFYADLANKHKVAPNASEVQSMSTPDLFAAGKAAIAMGGHWRYQTFIRADGLDFDVTPLPVGPRRHGQPAALQYRYHRTGHLDQQSTQGAGMGIREIRDRPRRAGADR